jgi:hypothetical protein
VFVYDPGGNLTRIRAIAACEILAAQFGNPGFPVRVHRWRPAVWVHIQRNASLPDSSGSGAKSFGEFADSSFFVLHYSSILTDYVYLALAG